MRKAKVEKVEDKANVAEEAKAVINKIAANLRELKKLFKV